jgi:hypothetical protein
MPCPKVASSPIVDFFVNLGALMHARMWDGNVDRIDFVNVSLPPEVASLIDKASTLLSMDWSSGKSAHRGNLESDRGRPR